MGGTNGAEGPRQHLGQQEMGLGAPGRQGYTVVHTDSEFGSGSSLPSNASGAASVQSSRGQSLPQGLGREGLVGAGALVTEGKHFPDRSLIVGAPARATRTLDEAAVARLRRSADDYVANWRRFAAGLAEPR